ncbi:hypothetical protein PLESTF_001180300 [Pleodorina starrii]|nr:hypothetical protein PLESTM_000110200 [Pleodorina starrii]GLC71911.1 hypothetical protein PLESTF_001180300 [Pleodorina starrii]
MRRFRGAAGIFAHASKLFSLQLHWALAAMAVSGAIGISTSGDDGFAEVSNGRDLAIALANQFVSDIILVESITLHEDDWSGLGVLPIVLERNVTILGKSELVAGGDLPVFNGSFVKNKVKLPSGIMLTLTGIILTWYREDIPSSTPGIDLLSYSTNATGPPPLLVCHKIALNNRFCFPEGVSRQSVSATRRPDAIPGTQNVTFDLPQPGCRNESTGPWLTRCYPARRRYIDVAAYGANLGPAGVFERTGYLVHAIETELLCSGLMTDECIAKYGSPFGCYYAVLPKAKTSPSPPAQYNNMSTMTTQQAPAAQQDVDTTPPRRRVVLIAVLCATLGTAVLVAAVAAAAALRWRRRLLPNQLAPTYDSWSWSGREPHSGNCAKEIHCSDGARVQQQQQQQQQDPSSDTTMSPQLTGEPLPPAAKLEPCENLNLNLGESSEANSGAGNGGGYCGGQQPAANTDPPVITLQTRPRPDMHLLEADPYRHRDDEVVLLPNATRGVGSFGRVVEGVFKGQRVAVKLVADAYQWGGPSESLLRSFAQEVEVLCRCQHPNVVRLLAACLTPPRVCLVMELMETSLERLMYPLPRRPAGRHLLPVTTVLHVSLQISKGLEYLHPTIVHRDLKPGNVLLNGPDNARPVVKLTDFGLSRLRSTEVPTQTPDAGTPAYLAPEGLDPMNYVITHKADIYSLAIMMWEMVAGERPWRDCNVMEMAIKVILQGCRPPLEHLCETRCPPKLRQLIQRCWDGDPRRRPAAAEVAKSLALILQEVESRGGGDGGGAAVVGGAASGPRVSVEPAEGDVASAAANAEIAAQALGGGGDGSPGDPSGGPGRRDVRVLERQVTATDVMAAIIDAAGHVSPEALQTSAVRPLCADEPPAASHGDADDDQTQQRQGPQWQQTQPQLPEPPAGCGPRLNPIAVAVSDLFGKKLAKRGGSSGMGAAVKQQQQLMSAAVPPGGSAYTYHGGPEPRACAVGFLGTSEFETWTGDKGKLASSELVAGPGTRVPAAAAASGPIARKSPRQPSGQNSAPALREPPALAFAPGGTC